MKKLLLTLIVSVAFCGSIIAQHPDSHWPGFNYRDFQNNAALYASIMINGAPVTTATENWDVLEVAAFVGDEMRMTGMYLTDEYLEYGELFPTINADPIYFDEPNEEVSFKMYNHATGDLYEVCEPVIWDGDPITILTGENHWEGFDDPDHPLMLNFIGGEPQPTTFTKPIEAVGSDNWEGGKGGYYLIASPLADAVDPATEGMNMITDELGAEATPETSTYDLYWFNQEEDLEWQNYRASTFNLENGKGYLYASKEGTTITFTGTPYSGDGEVTLSVDENNTEFGSWNLVGNPFGEDAYIDKPCYTLENSENYTTNDAGTAIHAMQGLLVVAEGNETLTFNKVSAKKNAKLNMNLRNGNKQLDNAIIVFGEGQQLGKLSFRENSSKIYMPIEGKDYAVVSAESNMGEMPVSFKAEKNGSYTLSFNAEEVSFNYLHLIDNMTGNDVDLLSTPSYSFDARTSDYANRFKLVFATGNASDDTFAFFSNDSFVINNEGNATLQVVDVNGRILSSETINGCANVKVNAAPGVYMIRLVNGDNVKIQKVVVK